jgi:excisionase family DNA binding protein
MNAAPQLPTPESARQAREALRLLRSGKRRPKLVRVLTGKEGQEITLHVPREAFELFTQILAQMANGNAVTLVPVHAELTTQQAADMLNVSRPFLVGLLDKGTIPYRLVGTHRRVRAQDVLEYQKVSYEKSKAAIDELSRIAQDEELGY